MGARHTSIHIRGISASVATLQINHRCISFSGDITHAEGVKAATEDEATAADGAYPWVTAAASAAAMTIRRSGTPGTNGLPRAPPVGVIPPPTVPPPGTEIPPGVPPPAPVPDPPGPGTPLPKLVNILPCPPSESHASAVARPGGPLVPGAVAEAPKGWAGRPRAARPVLDPQPGMRKALLPPPPQWATLWSFALLVGGLTLRLRRVRYFVGSLLHRHPRLILRPPRPRPLPPLRYSPPSPTFGPHSCQAWEGSDPGRWTGGARGARSPDNTPPGIRLAGALGTCGCARRRFRPPGP